MPKVYVALTSVLALLLWGCMPQPEISRRFAKDTTDWSGVAAESVELTSFTTDVPADSQPLLLKLSDRGQSAFIDAAAKDPDKTKTLLLALSGKKAPGAKRDFSLFERRVVLTTDPVNFRPGDRIAETKIIFELIGDADFVSWSRFANEFGEVDLGTISLTQGNTFNAELSATVPAAGPLTNIGGTLTNTSTRSLTEQMPLKRSFVKISGALTPRDARLTQRGDVGIDLSGTAAMDLDIRIREVSKQEELIFAFSDLYKDDKLVQASDVRVSVENVRLPAQACPVRAKVYLESTIRKVVSGADTIIEGDDNVVFEQQPRVEVGTVDLIKPEDIETLVWMLDLPDTGDTLGVRPDLMPKNSASWGTVVLGSREEANQLRQWLADLSTKPPGRIRNADIGMILGSSGGHRPLTPRDIDNLRIEPAREMFEGAQPCPQ
jgi:hypothetical protein